MSSSPPSPSSPLTGSCFCGAITYALSSPPVLRAYCHCTQCQRLTGCPFIHTLHFPSSAFSWTHDAPVHTFINPHRPWKTRTRCQVCGVTIASHNSKTDRVSVWGSHLARDDSGCILHWEDVRPTAHMFYGTRLLEIDDNLGKWEGYEGKSDRIA
ncbi:Mss4-like protein [Multifurca ochricompacta]|uniref:Mss4-like protein n=1 Tax=Multifurca ochricompacta TaxID=376703 RepID=A0AAD4MCK8_9AGAM|nr:Mss4-like protein [Multifurca ochricompacta]